LRRQRTSKTTGANPLIQQAELLGAAQAYNEQGFAVIPFIINPKTGKKEPDTFKVPHWRQWQTQPQTKAEFDSLHLENYTLFGVICGTPISKDGETFYFVGIDRDVKDEKISEETKQRTLKALNEMKPYTHREKTRSGGNHVCYYSRKPVEGKKLNEIGMELLAKGNLMVMAPSEGYTKENDNPISTVENAGEIFYKALQEAGLYTNQPTKPYSLKKAEIKNAPLRPCFTKLMTKNHLEHAEKVALIYEMFYCGMSLDQIMQVFQEHQAREPAPEHTFDPQKTASQIVYTFNKAKEGNFRYRSETLAAEKICFPECELRKLNDCRRLHPTLTELCERDATLNKIRSGDLNDYPTAEDALAAFVATLFSYDFSIREAKEALNESKIEKWLKGSDFFREKVFKKADKIVNTETEQDGPAEQERESQADRMYRLFCETSNIDLFHDQNKTEYARIPLDTPKINAINAINAILTTNIASNCEESINPASTPPTRINCENTVNSVNSVICKEIVRLDSERFKQYLTHLLFVAEGKVANNESKSQVISLLKYDANKGKYYRLYNRIAPDPQGKGFWLDTANVQNQAYHITKDGWTLESDVPILFKREEHQQALAEATQNGDIKLLLPFLNIGAGKDTAITKRRQLLLLVQIASYFIAEIPHPVNAMYGCPGSHKSCTQRYIRTIVDPSAAPLLRIPRDENAALQVLDHHYVPIFDQIFFLPQWFSDMLCSAVTGAGQESRALYTNDDPFIRSFKRCIMINGVNRPVTKGDLINRTLLHPTEPTEQRLTEKELDADFAKALPSILGGFLDVIVKALNYYGTVEAKPTMMFRMADFTEWGCAIALALGKTVADFITAMEENLANQTASDIESNNVAEAFLAYVTADISFRAYTNEAPYTTTPTDIFKAIEAKAIELGTNTKNQKKWPSITSAFTRKLNDSKNSIIASGWNYDIFHDGKSRKMTIWSTKAAEPTTDTRSSLSMKTYPHLGNVIAELLRLLE